MWFEHLCIFLNDILVRFAFTLSASQVHVVKKWCRVSQINIFHQFLPHGPHSLLSSSHCNVIHPHVRMRIILVFDEQQGTPSSELFPIQFQVFVPAGKHETTTWRKNMTQRKHHAWAPWRLEPFRVTLEWREHTRGCFLCRYDPAIENLRMFGHLHVRNQTNCSVNFVDVHFLDVVSVYSLHDRVVPPNPWLTSELFGSIQERLSSWIPPIQRSEMNAQSINRCLITRLICTYSLPPIFRHNCSLIRDGWLHAWK